jgi:hypothetical protein
MTRCRALTPWCVLGLLAGLVAWNGNATAAGSRPGDGGQKPTEMPVLTGTVWRTMTADEKVAFVWGIGHVVTIERQAAQRCPGLTQPNFAAKLAEGLAGMSMNEIVQRIDRYYADHADDVETPAMEVIWVEMVQPKLKTGIADLPLQPTADSPK